MFEKIKSLLIAGWNHFWALSFWKRAVLASALGALGGSTLLAVLNRYALYVYAYSVGVRIPVEGVPYLDLAVSLVSFALFLASLLGALGVYGFLTFLAAAIARIPWKHKDDPKAAIQEELKKFTDPVEESMKKLQRDLAKLSKRKENVQALLGLLGTITGIVSMTMSFLNAGLMVFSTAVAFAAILGSLFAIARALSQNPNAIRLTAIAVTTLGFLVIIAALFYTPLYAGFLYRSGFGGGIPVSIDYRTGESSHSTQNGDLLVATNSAIFVRTDLRQVVEIPRERVSRITYYPALPGTQRVDDAANRNESARAYDCP